MKKILILIAAISLTLPLLASLIGYPKTNIAQLMTGPN